MSPNRPALASSVPFCMNPLRLEAKRAPFTGDGRKDGMVLAHRVLDELARNPESLLVLSFEGTRPGPAYFESYLRTMQSWGGGLPARLSHELHGADQKLLFSQAEAHVRGA